MKKHNQQIIEKSKELHQQSLENNKELIDKSTHFSKRASRKSAILNIVFGIAMILCGIIGIIWLNSNKYLSGGLITLGALTLLLHSLRLHKMKKSDQDS